MKEKLYYKGHIETSEASPELIKLAQERGIRLPHPALGAFSSILCDIEDSNGNSVRLSRNAVEEALDTLIGTQINPNHNRNLALGHTFHAEITKDDKVKIAFLFFKDIFPREHEEALAKLVKGELAVSFEISADRETMEHLSDGTRRVNDFTFLGTGLLFGVTPACSNAFVDEFAYLNKKDPELMFAKKMTAQDSTSQIFIVTSSDDRHFHVAEVDMEGNGQTISGHGDGRHDQPHRILNWQIQEAESTISDNPHVHSIDMHIMAEVKERIKSRKYKDPNDPKHKRNSSLEKKETEKKNSQEEHKSMDEEQKKLVAELREELGDFAKEVKDEELLDEAKVKELREAKEKAEAKKEEKSDLEKAQTRIKELEAENEELKSTLEAKDSEIEDVRKNAETIAKRKIEFKDNEYAKDFTDEDYLDDQKLNEAKIKKENDELKAENETLKKKKDEKAEDKKKAEKKENVEKANFETGAESEEKEIDPTDFVTARVKEYKKRNK